MTAVTLEEIQRDLKGYLERVHAGETLIVLQADQPLAEIKPVSSETLRPRPFGLCAGEFTVPDDFNAPLPEEDDLRPEYDFQALHAIGRGPGRK